MLGIYETVENLNYGFKLKEVCTKEGGGRGGVWEGKGRGVVEMGAVDMLGVDETGDNLNYGFKLKEVCTTEGRGVVEVAVVEWIGLWYRKFYVKSML